MRALVGLVLCSLLLGLPLPAVAQSLVPEEQIESVEERRLLVSIERQYDKLSERETLLEQREMELKTLEAEVDKKLAAMQELRDELRKLLDRKKLEEGKRIGELSAIYEKMEPGKAARLIKELDEQVAIELLIGIKKKTAGKILDNLDAKTATSLSKAFTRIPVRGKTGY